MLAEGAEFGSYRIERLLGHGGMGAVYEAIQLSLDRTVALKVVSPELSSNPEFRERFRREGRQQAAIEHDHIVPVFEAGEAEHRLYIAMRLIPGSNLKQLIRAGGLEDTRTLRLLSPVAAALDAAHDLGLIHRDVKPQNILVDPREHAYLADFGLTKAADQTALTTTGKFIGTLHYSSPEQLRGEEAAAAGDVYSFAAVLYECLTGAVPFQRPSEAAVISAHLFDAPPHVSEARPELPEAVDEVLRRGMAKEPADRQPTAAALMEDVEDALGGVGRTRTAEPLPPAPLKEAKRRAGELLPRRWMAGLLGAAAIAALVAAGLLLGDGEEGDAPAGGAPAGVAPAPRSATVQLGSGLTASELQGECTTQLDESCTLVQTELPGQRLRSPIDGVITRWRVRDAGGRVALQVLRGSRRRAAAAVSSQRNARAKRVEVFTARLRIARGDGIGLLVGERTRFGLNGIRGSKFLRFGPPLGPEPRAFGPSDPGPGPPGYEALFNADVEPDEDDDGFGDASQDRCPGEAGNDRGCG